MEWESPILKNKFALLFPGHHRVSPSLYTGHLWTHFPEAGGGGEVSWSWGWGKLDKHIHIFPFKGRVRIFTEFQGLKYELIWYHFGVYPYLCVSHPGQQCPLPFNPQSSSQCTSVTQIRGQIRWGGEKGQPQWLLLSLIDNIKGWWWKEAWSFSTKGTCR